jgi:hypothetical protein
MKPLSDQQRLYLIESDQLYRAWREVLWRQHDYKYGMRWKTVNDKDYLIRLTNAKGGGRSLGVRSPATEDIYQQFMAGKELNQEKYKGLEEKLKTQKRLNRALRLGRMPTVIGDILVALDEVQALNDFRVVGTHALFAYEALAAVEFKIDLLASGDIDLLYDNRKSLSVVAKKMDNQGFLGLLKRVDKSFEIKTFERFRAVNKDGFMVDLITQDRGMLHAKQEAMVAGDFELVEIPNLEWLINAPKITQVAISASGQAVMMPVPDPRAFAVHKAWLSNQPDREPVKKTRDFGQAAMLYALLQEYLPNYPMDQHQMKYFPKDVVEKSLHDLNFHLNQVRLPT